MRWTGVFRLNGAEDEIKHSGRQPERSDLEQVESE
jgi:hypothetical protein